MVSLLHLYLDMDKDAPRIFTGRYGDKAIAGSGLVAVGITRYAPRFRLAYELKANLTILAPTAAMLAKARSGKLTARQFEARYVAQLEEVGAERILTTLRQLQGDAPGIVLLCYEDVTQGQTCHRRMFADWFQRKAGIMVPEFTTTARVAAIGYVRRSHESTERTVSLAAQRTAIERYAAEQGWSLAAVVEHDGISGGRRSRFTALDAAIKAHGAHVVICYHLDRLARDAAALLDWCAGAAKRGVALHVVGRGRMETASSSGYLGVGVEALVSEHFRLVCSEKTAGALRHLKEAGRRWTKTAPFGYRWSSTGKVEPDPVEQDVIVRARELRDAGLSLRTVARELAAASMLSRAGTPLSAETLASILRRRS